MAFSDGDHLTSCLDLVHVAAQSLWIEWIDAAREIELPATDAENLQWAATAQRAGALLKACRTCAAVRVWDRCGRVPSSFPSHRAPSNDLKVT